VTPPFLPHPVHHHHKEARWRSPYHASGTAGASLLPCDPFRPFTLHALPSLTSAPSHGPSRCPLHSLSPLEVRQSPIYFFIARGGTYEVVWRTTIGLGLRQFANSPDQEYFSLRHRILKLLWAITFPSLPLTISCPPQCARRVGLPYSLGLLHCIRRVGRL